MNEPAMPTAETIEAALSAYNADHPNGISDTGDFETFMRIMGSNKRLRAELDGALTFVTDIKVPPEMQAEFTEIDMVKFKIASLSNLFFWVGWHARGAVEDSEKMRGFQ